MRALVLAAGVGSALVGGVFFAFSAFVLPALGRLPAGGGAAAMRSINVLAVRPPLLVALFGTALVCTVTGVVAVRRGEGWVAAGFGTYLVGVVLVTVVADVPLNDRLADHQLDFTDYARTWGRWNLVRTAAGVTAAALLLAAHASPLRSVQRIVVTAGPRPASSPTGELGVLTCAPCAAGRHSAGRPAPAAPTPGRTPPPRHERWIGTTPPVPPTSAHR